MLFELRSPRFRRGSRRGLGCGLRPAPAPAVSPEQSGSPPVASRAWGAPLPGLAAPRLGEIPRGFPRDAPNPAAVLIWERVPSWSCEVRRALPYKQGWRSRTSCPREHFSSPGDLGPSRDVVRKMLSRGKQVPAGHGQGSLAPLGSLGRKAGYFPRPPSRRARVPALKEQLPPPYPPGRLFMFQRLSRSHRSPSCFPNAPLLGGGLG